jgi:hypothetical protein
LSLRGVEEQEMKIVVVVGYWLQFRSNLL